MMAEEISDYRTVTIESEGYFKDKGSKFIAIVKHVETEEEVKEFREVIKKKYYDARHHCYAYRINPENEFTRSSDDGEPSGTAGKPMLNQLLSINVTNTLVIVVRYFGGTKLGVSGLIQAYKAATIDALENNKIVKKYITSNINVSFEYPLMNSVMKVIKDENLKIKGQNYDTNCNIILEIKKNQKKIALNKFHNIRGVTIT